MGLSSDYWETEIMVKANLGEQIQLIFDDKYSVGPSLAGQHIVCRQNFI